MKTTILSVITFLTLAVTSLALPVERIYAAYISGDGQGNISVSELRNDFTGPLEWEETAVGEYRGVLEDSFPEGLVSDYAKILPDGSYIYASRHDDNKIVVKEYDGVGGNPVCCHSIYIEIKVYSPPS